MEKEKKEDKKVDLFLILISYLIYPIVYFFSFRSTIFGDIAFAVTIVFILSVLYFFLKKKYHNSFRLVILLGLHLLIFPFIQVTVFKAHNSEFTFNSDFLNQKIILAKSDLSKIDGADGLKQIIHENKFHLINHEIPDKLIGKTFYFKDYSIAIKKADWRLWRHPNNRPSPSNKTKIINRIPKKIIIDFHSIQKRLNFEIANETFLEKINKIIHESKELTEFIKNPILIVKSNDIWLDSVSGFLLGNVKPNSRLSQIIQLIQLFNLFLITLILSDLIVNSKWLTLSRKNT